MVNEITSIIHQAGGRAFLVGGSVRDQIMGLESKDIDIEVHGLDIEYLIKILSTIDEVELVGKSFGVLKLKGIDISIPRIERKIGSKHTDFDVLPDPHLSLQEAFKRRDLTINALGKDLHTGEVIDLFGGLEDIKNSTLRHVNDETFIEDPLRILRVAQFSSRFNFNIHDSTFELCKSIVNELRHISRERIQTEIEKALFKSTTPSKFFRVLDDLGALELLLPEIYKLKFIDQGKKYHNEGSVFEHTMLTIDVAAKFETKTPTLMYAALTHDLGKITVEPKILDVDHIGFYGHAEEGAILTRDFLTRLTNNNDLIESVVPLVEQHMALYQLKKDLSKRSVRRLASKVNFTDLVHLHICDKLGRNLTVNPDLRYVDDIFEVYKEVRDQIKPIVMGRNLIDDLKLTPSKEFGKILGKAYDAQLEGLFNDLDSGLEYIKTNILKC